MSQDALYKVFPYIFKSKGICARVSPDRIPEHMYQNLDNVEEREEDTFSSRLGSQIINRDPSGTGTSNYFFTHPPFLITRLKSVFGATTRYVCLAQYGSATSILYRTEDTQGAFSAATTPSSNGAICNTPFSTIVTTCFQSATPYIFFAGGGIYLEAIGDPVYGLGAMLKDNGTGTFTHWGIDPPTALAIPTQYARVPIVIENFTSASGFSGTLTPLTAEEGTGEADGTGATQILGQYTHYNCSNGSTKFIQDGMLVEGAGAPVYIYFSPAQDGTSFNVYPQNTSASSVGYGYVYVEGTIGANSTATIGKSISPSLLANSTDDSLIAIAIYVADPDAISSINLQFDVDSSGYTSSFYSANISPASFQNGIFNPLTSTPSDSVTSEVTARAVGVSRLLLINSATSQIIPTDDPSIGQLQPAALSTGQGSWAVIYLPRSQFLPVGQAGSVGNNWSNITGWRVQITSTTAGSTVVGFNALYMIPLDALSSFGGVGYDYRYTYFNALTGTESNPSSPALFPITSYNPAGTSTLILINQAVSLSMVGSADSQVTHIRIYRRGGTLPTQWLFLDQVANTNGTVTYKDIIPDAQLEESSVLNVANDRPVTSTLQNPVNTTLQAALTATIPPTILTVNTNGSDAYKPTQLVVIDPGQQNQEILLVEQYLSAGEFNAYVQLNHAVGAIVQSYAIPSYACSLAEVAYGLVWLAGDSNNPHYLYYSNPGYPENFSPAQYIPVGSANDPIMAVINFKGTLFVATLTTWYQIFSGASPYAQPTGSKHGLVATQGWCRTESAILYQAIDGIREFRGADGEYLSLSIEWLFQNVGSSPLAPTPIVKVNLALLSQVTMAFWNNLVFVNYPGQDGNNHRLILDLRYRRWRNDDVNATAIYHEEDTNDLLYTFEVSTNHWALTQDRINDYDDGGWSGASLVETPISYALQTPYIDLGLPNNQKQFNQFTLDVNPNGSTLNVTLYFDDNNGAISPINLGNITGTIRQKFQLTVTQGRGQQAYRVSVLITGSVTVAPILYQMDIHAAVLAEVTQSYDTYWVKFGTDESKLVKQGFFDYTSQSALTVNLYADGADPSLPYYTFTLPENLTRTSVPMRVRFPMAKLRLFRMVITSTEDFQLWSSPQVDQKAVLATTGYVKTALHSAANMDGN